MRLLNPYSLEETLEKLRHGLTTASNENALTLLEKAVTKARDDPVYARRLKRPCYVAPPSRYASVSAALATTSSDPETRRPITRITMPPTALIVRSTPSCLMPPIPTHSRSPITYGAITPSPQTRINSANTMTRISRHNPQGHLTTGGFLHFKESSPCLLS